MSNNDIRWHQRLDNFNKALKQLTSAIAITEKRKLTQLEEQGLIQAFEFNFELSWNLMKDYYEDQGEMNIQGSRDAFRLAFKRGLILNGDTWMSMIKSRMLTSHTYNENTAQEISQEITSKYYAEFVTLNQTMNALKLTNT